MNDVLLLQNTIQLYDVLLFSYNNNYYTQLLIIIIVATFIV